MLADFMLRRYKLLTTGPGNICNPAASNVAKYAPFQSDDYAHARVLGDLASPEWKHAFDTDPYALLHPNPFELSQYRISNLDQDSAKSVYRFRCWDSAIAIPACGIRAPEPKPFGSVQIVRRTNEQWNGEALPAILHTGPLGKDGALLRPRGRHIFDLTATRKDFAWDLLEMAHVMGHQHDEFTPDVHTRNKALHNSASCMQRAITEIVFAIMYGLPVDVGTDRLPGAPNTYFGTDLKCTTDFRKPVLRLPWKTNDAPRPDTTLSIALSTVFIQPHPHGFTTNTGECDADDIWCCMPSIVAVVGWEGIDFITHQALGYNPFSSKRRGHYTVPADDLLSPELYWAYLALATRTSRGDCVPLFTPPDAAVARSMAAIARAEQAEAMIMTATSLDVAAREKAVNELWETERRNIKWVYPREWLETGHYRWLYQHTPPLPCKYCMTINRNAEGAPVTPKGQRPTGPRKTWPKDWVRWEQDLAAIRDILHSAIVNYEIKRYGRKAARIRRVSCTRGARARYASLRIMRQAAIVHDNESNGRDSTPAQWNAYYKVKQGL
jgi:hypothetical protein